MKNIKVYIIILLFVLIIPSIVYATWWNPFSWHIWDIFNIFSKSQTGEVQQNQDQNATPQTPTIQTTDGISSPAYNDVWQIGKTYSVKWNSSIFNDKVSVSLVNKDNNKVCNFNGVANTGTYAFTVPAKTGFGSCDDGSNLPGNHYQINVWTKATTLNSQIFSLTAAVNTQNSTKDCKKISYPQFEKVALKYSVTIKPIDVALVSGDDATCGIQIMWNNKPNDLNICLQRKDDFLKELDSIKIVPRNLVFFYCGDYMSGADCISKPTVWECDISQDQAFKRGDKTMEAIFKGKKCGVAKENPAFLEETFDCPGMIDYTMSLCLESKNDLANIWACEALAENARYITEQKDEAMRWYGEACKKYSADKMLEDFGKNSCSDSKGY